MVKLNTPDSLTPGKNSFYSLGRRFNGPQSRSEKNPVSTPARKELREPSQFTECVQGKYRPEIHSNGVYSCQRCLFVSTNTSHYV